MEILLSNQEKAGAKHLFQASNFVCFCYCCFQINITTKRKGKKNFETKYSTIENNQSLKIYCINENFYFSSNNYCSCVIIHHIFKDARAEQWPNFQLTVALHCIKNHASFKNIFLCQHDFYHLWHSKFLLLYPYYHNKFSMQNKFFFLNIF